MSIRRSGLKNAVYVICTSTFQSNDYTLKAGEKYELVHDLGSMYVIKNAEGQEIIAPKDIFRDE